MYVLTTNYSLLCTDADALLLLLLLFLLILLPVLVSHPLCNLSVALAEAERDARASFMAFNCFSASCNLLFKLLSMDRCRRCTDFASPESMANSRAVFPVVDATVRSPPLDSNSSTVLWWWPLTASCNAVQPVFWEEVVQVGGGGGRGRGKRMIMTMRETVTIKSEAPR